MGEVMPVVDRDSAVVMEVVGYVKPALGKDVVAVSEVKAAKTPTQALVKVASIKVLTPVPVTADSATVAAWAKVVLVGAAMITARAKVTMITQTKVLDSVSWERIL
mmetsp:Transcript_64841/g.138891  ORF Transcript_64841/g.138891 Transcript_64841/m.138891 type:complete len:106 (-) Transcript_64841:1356-1673(-)